MPDAVLYKLGHALNAATQRVANEVVDTASESEDASHVRVVKHLSGVFSRPKIAPDAAGFAVSERDLLRPAAVGWHIGASAALAYEQGAKFLFGRGQRHVSYAGNRAKLQPGQFPGKAGYQKEVYFQDHGEKLQDPVQEKARIGAIYANNLRALKQDGLLGLTVKGVVMGVGNIIGAAFGGDAESARVLDARLIEAAHTINAAARLVLMSAPMVGLVLVGVTVGLGFSAVKAGTRRANDGIRAWQAARARAGAASARSSVPQTHPTSAEAATAAPPQVLPNPVLTSDDDDDASVTTEYEDARSRISQSDTESEATVYEDARSQVSNSDIADLASLEFDTFGKRLKMSWLFRQVHPLAALLGLTAP